MGLHKKFYDDLNVIANNMKKIRTNNKISLANLSNKLMLMGVDISKQSLYRIEKNERSVRDYELSAIAIALGVSSEDLLSDFTKNIRHNL